MSATEAGAFGVSFESTIKRSEKRVAGPTVSLVRDVLFNAGMDEGEWALRDSRRIKKKGRGRFHAIRIESRGGLKGIRVWCKPRGNDSCFEYTLVPPAEIDLGTLFDLLRRVNPVSLEIPESKDLPRAFIDHVIGVRLEDTLRPYARRGMEITEEPQAEIEEESEKEMEFSPEAEAEIKEAVLDLNERGVGPGEVAAVLSPCPKISNESLLLDEAALMSDQEVMDKALLAISFVAEGGYVKRTSASASIIESLGIKNFVENISGGTYTSVEGAMRALTMALRNKGRYLERVHYTADDGSVSEGVRGYKLTPRAEKRILAIKALYSESLTSRIRADWSGSPETSEETRRFAKEEFNREEEPARESGLNSDDLPRLKSLISAHEEADLQLREIEGILGHLDSEIADINLDITGLDLAEKEKIKQIESLQDDLGRLRAKISAAASSMDRKKKERREWEAMRNPHLSEKVRVEADICKITGRSKQW